MWSRQYWIFCCSVLSGSGCIVVYPNLEGVAKDMALWPVVFKKIDLSQKKIISAEGEGFLSRAPPSPTVFLHHVCVGASSMGKPVTTTSVYVIL